MSAPLLGNGRPSHEGTEEGLRVSPSGTEIDSGSSSVSLTDHSPDTCALIPCDDCRRALVAELIGVPLTEITQGQFMAGLGAEAERAVHVPEVSQ